METKAKKITNIVTRKVTSFLSSRLFVLIALAVLQVWFIMFLMSALESISEIVTLVLTISSLLLVLWVVNKKQNLGYTVAWVILILILPIFGMTMYFFFSQRKMNPRDRSKVIKQYAKSIHLMRPRPGIFETMQDKDIRRQSAYIFNAAIEPPYENSEVRYLPTGEAFFAALLEELEKAEKYIFMEYFIIEEGVMWDPILEILERKAAQGLDVRFMYDDIGCASKVPSSYYKTLRAKGIRCEVFNTLKPILNSMFNNRDHRKITVIDGKTAFCGGTNLADEYINVTHPYGQWKDASVMVRGEAVFSLLVIFMNLWGFTSGDDESLDGYHADIVPARDACGIVQPFSDSPIDNNYISESVFINLISRAKDYVYIMTPYLVIGNELSTLLATAATSGVDVRIIVPHVPDKKLVFMLTQSYYAQLIKSGVKVYEYLPGFIHSKVLLSDDQTAVVGTINLDYRSMYLHFECGVWMHGCPAIQDIRQDFDDTFAISKEISFADTVSVPWYKRFFRAILQIFGPLM